MLVNQPITNLQEFSQLENLELLAKQIVEGFIIGLHKSPFHGFSVEFAEHRTYNAGEPIKSIDWKVFARTDRMYVKKFEEETNLRCQIVIDDSSSMYFPASPLTFATANSSFGEPLQRRGELSKIHFSIIAAAALMHLLKKQRDAVGLTIFSDEIELHTKAKSNIVHQKMLFSNLEKLLIENKKNKSTSVAKSLHLIAENIHKRSLVIIFSDAMENKETSSEIFPALQHLKHNKHEVIFFHVVDKKKEMDFEFENRPYQFIDVETSETVKLQPNKVKEYYTEQMKKFKKELDLKCGQYGIDLVEADINQNFDQILLPYLVKRTKML